MNSVCEPDGLGGFRALAVQGTQLWVGPVHVGVMSAREGDLPDGGTGLRAKLSIQASGEDVIRVVRPREMITIDGLGTLVVAGIAPPGSSEEAGEFGVVGLEFHPSDSVDQANGDPRDGAGIDPDHSGRTQ